MARSNTPENVKRGPGGKWLPGTPPPNPTGRPKVIGEIEAMLDAEHRTVENMREVFSRLKALALGEIIEVKFKGEVVGLELKALPAFMALYLERVLGPVKDWKVDLTDAPKVVIDYLADKVN